MLKRDPWTQQSGDLGSHPASATSWLQLKFLSCYQLCKMGKIQPRHIVRTGFVHVTWHIKVFMKSIYLTNINYAPGTLISTL